MGATQHRQILARPFESAHHRHSLESYMPSEIMISSPSCRQIREAYLLVELDLLSSLSSAAKHRRCQSEVVYLGLRSACTGLAAMVLPVGVKCSRIDA